MRTLVSGLAGLFVLASRLSAATVTVNDAGDTTNPCATTGLGTCTLRDALTYATAHGGSTVAFGIAGAGAHTIQPASAYPGLVAPMTIDGFTQPGSLPNSNGPGLGDNSVHLIEIDGTHACGANPAVLNFGTGSNDSVVRGLVINRCNASAIMIALSTTSGHVIEGNFLGTDPTGMIASPNSFGILVDIGAMNVTIGGTTPASRNVLSGNIAGIGFGNGFDNGGSGHHVEGNFIGTNAAGTGALPNQIGISMHTNISGSTIGGAAPGARNVISGNTGSGVGMSSFLGDPNTTGNSVMGNFIGVDVTGSVPLGNGGDGIFVGGHANTVGGGNPGEGNVIAANLANGIEIVGGDGTIIKGNRVGTDAGGTQAFGNHDFGLYVAGSNVVVGGIAAGEGNTIVNNGKGVLVINGTQNTIRGNAIHNASGLGIDLGSAGGPDGVTPNDAADADTGANNLQNFPLISSVTHPANTTVTGRFHSTASTTFDLDFYSNPACSNFPREFLQGEVYLGSSQVTTDGAGNASFSVTTLPATASGSRISVTATDPQGNTSEFSQRLPFSVDVHSGPPAGGTAIVITGTDFATGATVTIGGQPAADIDVSSSTSLTATTPVLAAGLANDIVVTNTDTTNGTLVKGFVSDFLDVAQGNQFYGYVTALVSNAITAGVGGGLYGVNDSTLRQQMAVFILKAKHGLCYRPPSCTGVFPDVPCSSAFAPWIEAMSNEGITGGCGGGNFCPQNPVRRDQMAVFLLKAEHGSSYQPPMCTGAFPDVPCPSTFANWIEQLANEAITGGCGGGGYCPGNNNTRGQMAVFITKTFNLP
jgi:IPT/TIG domain/S-layer homology domain